MHPLTKHSVLITASLAIACGEPAPDGMELAIIPEQPTTLDPLTAVVPRRPEGEGVTYAYAWSLDGAPVGDLTSTTVPADRTQAGQVWSVVATPTSANGNKEGATATAEITIANTAPVGKRVTIVPREPTSSDPLTAEADGADIDEDELSWTFTWYVNGEEISDETSADLPIGTYVRGDYVDVVATPTDGTDAGPAVRSSPRSIGNSPPVVVAVDLTSADPDPHGFTDLSCEVTESFDQDDDDLDYAYEWRVNGEPVGRDELVINRIGRRGDEITCEARAHDGLAFGEWTASDTVTLVNTPPDAPELRIGPPEINDLHSPVCIVESGEVDHDGDPLTFTFAWTLNGAAWTGPVRDTTHPGDTIDNAYVEVDQEWACTAIGNDGTVDGAEGSSEAVVIRNSWAGPRDFTTCGETGHTGPTQADCDGRYEGTLLEDEVEVVDGFQYWEVPVTGRFLIEGKGAKGAVADTTWGSSSGTGAVISGEFELEMGDLLEIAVGQNGSTNSYEAGGGGGTWIIRDGEPLLIAGGGGGIGYWGSDYGYNGCNGSETEFATQGAGSSYAGCRGVSSSRRGEGGQSGCYWGEGGGGWESDGQGDTCWSSAGGKGYGSGLEGGTGWSSVSGTPHGGFGGGGSGAGDWGGGGGGGYSGGDASSRGAAGGGGSYNAGENPTASDDNDAAGAVLIDLLLD